MKAQKTVRSKPAWEKLLTSETELELKEMGRLLAEARQRRGMSIVELSNRIGVDRRTLAQLERGSPKVSVGIFFQALSALNLLRGIEEIARPENDIEGINTAIRKIRNRRPLTKTISEDKVNF